MFDRYYAPLCRFAEFWLRDRASAEEVVLDVYTHVWQHAAELRITVSVRAYLFRAVRNRALNRLRDDRFSYIPFEELGEVFASPESLQIETDERVQAMIHYRPNEETDESSLQLTMVTENGTVKRVAVSAFRNLRQNGIRALRLDEGDRLVSVLQTDGRSNILIATYDGMAVCFDENDVRSMGRDAVGVRGIRLREGDRVIGAACAVAGCQVLSITAHGFGKQTPVEEYRITNRGGIGIKNYMVTDKTGGVVGMKVVDGSEDLLLVTQSGIMLRTAVENIRSAGRATQGVIVMRFKEEGDQVIAMALTDKDEEE